MARRLLQLRRGPTGPSSTIDVDVAARWRFDEASGPALDDTGSGNDVAAVNSPASVAGVIASARRCTSGAAARFQAIVAGVKIRNDQSWTLCGWFRTSSLASTFQLFTHELTGAGDARLYCSIQTSGRVYAELYGLGFAGPRGTLTGTGGTVATNTWTFLRLWLDATAGAHGTVYLRTNEADQKSAALSGSVPLLASANVRWNGNVNNGQLCPGHLDLDQWRFYQRLMTDDEAADLFAEA